MPPILEMRGISKTFPGVKALDDVNLAVKPGEIHALVGENGAGKSTLMKVLSGVYPHGSYEGEIIYEGEPGASAPSRDSEQLGIIIIHQELALVPAPVDRREHLPRQRAGALRHHRLVERPVPARRELMALVGLNEIPDTLVTHLGVGKQQLVEIAKALSKEVKLLILDEPTASLSETDSEALLRLLLSFKEQGIASILISHKLNEISRVADRITVLRDGTSVETLDCRTTADRARTASSAAWSAATMARPLSRPRTADRGRALEVSDWTAHHPLHADRPVVRNVSLNLRRGEIVGIAGLMGSGRTELAMSLFGRSYGQGISGQRHHRRRGGRRLHHRPGDRGRPCLRHRGPQAARPHPRGGHRQEHDAREPAGRLHRHGDRSGCRAPHCGRVPHQDAHPLLRCGAAGREPVGRQPAEGRARASGSSQSPRC